MRANTPRSNRPRRLGAALVLVSLLSSLLVWALVLPAPAAIPPWEPDHSLTDEGNLTFYDASGNVITGGNTADLIPYIATDGTPGVIYDTGATLYGVVAQAGLTPEQWAAPAPEQMTATEPFPNASYPAPLNAGPHAVVSNEGAANAGNETIATLVSDQPPPAADAGTAYEDVYQLRLVTSGSGGVDPGFWETDIMVSGSTWTQIYPVPSNAVNTTTTLSVSPPSPQSSGTPLFLTATVTPSSATGTVQFLADGSAVGTTATVSAGVASTSIPSLSVGSHSLSAQFVPGSPGDFNSSTSAGVPYTINSAGASLLVSTLSLPNGTVSEPYLTTLGATGGVGPYAWSLSSGTLPAGLSLSGSTGVIAGTPTTPGTAAITVAVQDSSSPAKTASQSLTVTIDAAPAIATTSLPTGTVNVAYSASVSVIGGTAPYAWTLTVGSLPGGLTAVSSGGTYVISGKPTVAGDDTFTLQVTDSSPTPLAASQSFTITIAPAPSTATIETAALPDGVVGTPYSSQLAAAGGTPPYRWAVDVGQLPDGLTLDTSSGAITGTPATPGDFAFNVSLTDSTAPTPESDARDFVIDVAPNSDQVPSAGNGSGGSPRSAPPVAYVTNFVDGTVTPIDTITNQAGAAIPVGRGPDVVALSPDGAKVYVGNAGDSSVSVVDASTNSVVATVPLPSPAFELEATPDGSTVYAATLGGSVVPISTSSDAAGPPIGVGPGLADMVISPDGSTLYAASVTATEVTPISTSNNVAGTPIGLPSGALLLAISPNGQTLFIETVDAHLFTLSTSSKSLGPEVGVPDGLAVGMVASPDSQGVYLLTASAQNPSVLAFNAASGAMSHLTTLTGPPVLPASGSPIVITPNGKVLYALELANTGDAVLPVPLGSATASPAIPSPAGSSVTGTLFSALAMTPDGKTLYAPDFDTQSDTGTVVPITTGSNSPGAGIPVGSAPLAIAVTADQAPTAAFSVTPGAPGTPTMFDASASAATDGSIAEYVWNFGDGTTATTAGPTTTHVYQAPGSYTVGLAVVDSAGTSVTKVYDGRQMVLNGGLSALAVQALTIAASGTGYWSVGSDGGVFSYGSAQFFGSAGSMHLNKPIVGLAGTPDAKGYWLVASDGGIFGYGDAAFQGSTGSMHLNSPIVGMASTPDGKGYWLVASDGGIFAYGDAAFAGSAGAMRLNKPIVGMASTPDGKGYWLVASDGGIFGYGDAAFQGSTGSMHLNSPTVGMASTSDGKGYWLVASDGGIFAYGDAAFAGSAGALHLNKPIVGMAAMPDAKGYWLLASDGGIFAFGDAPFEGSAGSLHLNKPIVGLAGD
ncbi:MAG TPA: putative Ig domain-containing protein [Actinomycetota bacterium]|nr:putative Ig domain-containing protein [Actinomycetota bacterium]